MSGDRRETSGRDADWIFSEADPTIQPTDVLPGKEDVEALAAQRNAQRRVDRDGRDRRDEPETSTSEIAELAPEDGAVEAVRPQPSYARSGTTPNAEEGDLARLRVPARFAAMSPFDALRDVAALVCLFAALSTTFTLNLTEILEPVSRIAVGIALLALILVHVLRWALQEPPLKVIRGVRIVGMIPALVVAFGTLVVDLVFSLPVLFAPLPDGVPVGIGAGVSLLAVGAITGIEPRAHEGFLPGERARKQARTVLLVLRALAAAAFTLSLVMIVGRVLTTGWAFSLYTFASALVSALVIAIVTTAALSRDRTWFVLLSVAIGGLVIMTLADNSLRPAFASPISFATGFVYLPFLFSIWGVMVSRSFVRSQAPAFVRSDWLVYTVRAFELSVVMHLAATLWQVLVAIAAFGGAGDGRPVLHLMDAVVCACFVTVSLFARRALRTRPPVLARASAVVAGVVLVVVGFLDIMVNSLAAGAGAGLVTGGVALAVGIATALMLTVPAPVRDEFGAPDLGRMFSEFRRRDRSGVRSSVDAAADATGVDAERARKKAFPEPD